MMTPTEGLDQWLAAQWAVTASEHAIEVDDARITYRGWNLDAVELPGLLLVHGFRAHAHWWDHIAPSLAHSYRVAAIDLSGMGDSDHREAYPRAQYAREILAVADACGFEPVTLVAHSFGALASMRAAIAAPDRVQRLVIIDAGVPTFEDDLRRLPVPAMRRLYPSRDAALERFRLIPPGEWPHPAIVAYIARHSLRETEGGWTWKFDENAAASLPNHSIPDGLAGVPVPTDVIYGALTEVMRPERRAMLAKLAPLSGPPIAIPAAHHHILVEQPIALIAAVMALLAVPRG